MRVISNPFAGLPYANNYRYRRHVTELLFELSIDSEKPRQIDSVNSITKAGQERWRLLCGELHHNLKQWVGSQTRYFADPNYQRFGELNRQRPAEGKADGIHRQSCAESPYRHTQYIFVDEHFTSPHTLEDVTTYHRNLDEAFEQKRIQLETLRENYNRPCGDAVIERSVGSYCYLCHEVKPPVWTPELQQRWEARLSKTMGSDYIRLFAKERATIITTLRNTVAGGGRTPLDEEQYAIFRNLVQETKDDSTLNTMTRRQRLARLKKHPKTDDELWWEAIQTTFDQPWFKTAAKQRNGLYAYVRLNRRPARVVFLMNEEELFAISYAQVFSESADAIIETAIARAAGQVEGDRETAFEVLRGADLRWLTFDGKEHLKPITPASSDSCRQSSQESTVNRGLGGNQTAA